MKQNELYIKVIEKKGIEHQLRKLQEECCELGAAINHYLERRNNGERHLYEELADVDIVLSQMKMALSKDKFRVAKRKKLRRLRKRHG